MCGIYTYIYMYTYIPTFACARCVLYAAYRGVYINLAVLGLLTLEELYVYLYHTKTKIERKVVLLVDRICISVVSLPSDDCVA